MFRRLPAFFALLLFLLPSGSTAEGLDENSPEYAAITLATPYIQKENFNFREDYWDGVITGESGRAVRLQFFKRNTYRLFFAMQGDEVAKGTRLDVRILDKDNNVVAEPGEQKGAAMMVEFSPKKSDLYLVLMRLEVTEGRESRGVPCALFYGYE